MVGLRLEGMPSLFLWIVETEPFRLFSVSHLAALAVTAATLAGGTAAAKLLLRVDTSAERAFRLSIAAALLLQEILLNINKSQAGLWRVSDSLPLHLCSFSVVMGIAMLAMKSRYLFDVLYYWAAGAVVALFTPDLTTTDFPAFRFYQFFISHGLIVLSVLYLFVVHGYRPSARSLKRTLVFTHALMPFIAAVNYFSGGNYFFVARVPETDSPISLLGPWPLYIVWLELILLAVFGSMYLPFRLGRGRRA